ncbi:MAG: DUF1761 domain-containing protein [Alphaproteobacteria bacterium]
MKIGDVSVAGVAVAVIVGMAIGAMWYSPLLFGPQWMALSGYRMTEGAAEMMGVSYALGTLATIAQAVVLAILLCWLKVDSVRGGIIVAAIVWFGFAATTEAYGFIYAGHPIALFAINAGYTLVNFVAMAVVLSAWRARTAKTAARAAATGTAGKPG